MPTIIANFRSKYNGEWTATYRATSKRHFVYGNRHHIKKGVTITVEYKGKTYTKAFHKNDIRVFHKSGSGRVVGIVDWAKTFMKGKTCRDVWLFVSKVKIA